MKALSLIISLVSIIAVAGGGLLLNAGLRSYADQQARTVKDDVAGLRADIADIKASLDKFAAPTQKEFDEKLARLTDVEARLGGIEKRLKTLEEHKLAAAQDASENGASEKTGRSAQRDDLEATLESLASDDSSMSEEERKALQEKRSKLIRNLARGFGKEMMKMAKKQQQSRLAKAVNKLGLSVGQEEEMKQIIDDTMTKAEALMDRMFKGENVREEMQGLRNDADQQVKDILTEEQYEEWTKSDPWRGPGMGGGRRGPWGPSRGGQNGDQPQGK